MGKPHTSSNPAPSSAESGEYGDDRRTPTGLIRLRGMRQVRTVAPLRSRLGLLAIVFIVAMLSILGALAANHRANAASRLWALPPQRPPRTFLNTPADHP